jgi:hypothetical protein
MPIWRCEDCNKIGFYFDISPEEMIAKHRLECGIDASVSIKPAELTEEKDNANNAIK